MAAEIKNRSLTTGFALTSGGQASIVSASATPAILPIGLDTAITAADKEKIKKLHIAVKEEKELAREEKEKEKEKEELNDIKIDLLGKAKILLKCVEDYENIILGKVDPTNAIITEILAETASFAIDVLDWADWSHGEPTSQYVLLLWQLELIRKKLQWEAGNWFDARKAMPITLHEDRIYLLMCKAALIQIVEFGNWSQLGAENFMIPLPSKEDGLFAKLDLPIQCALEDKNLVAGILACREQLNKVSGELVKSLIPIWQLLSQVDINNIGPGLDDDRKRCLQIAQSHLTICMVNIQKQKIHKRWLWETKKAYEDHKKTNHPFYSMIELLIADYDTTQTYHNILSNGLERLNKGIPFASETQLDYSAKFVEALHALPEVIEMSAGNGSKISRSQVIVEKDDQGHVSKYTLGLKDKSTADDYPYLFYVSRKRRAFLEPNLRRLKVPAQPANFMNNQARGTFLLPSPPPPLSSTARAQVAPTASSIASTSAAVLGASLSRGIGSTSSTTQRPMIGPLLPSTYTQSSP